MPRTSKPWTVIADPDIYGGYILMEQKGDNEDALVADDDDNALLFSAAPELLEALEEMKGEIAMAINLGMLTEGLRNTAATINTAITLAKPKG